MRDFRLAALKRFERRRWPPGSPSTCPTSTSTTSTTTSSRRGAGPGLERPADAIKNTYEKLGIPRPSASTSPG